MSTTGVNHTNSHQDIIDFLVASGVDVEYLNKNGNKNLIDLSNEIHERDVVLTWDEELKRVVRHALSVKLLILARTGCFREARRSYPNGHVLENLCPWSISETQKRDEDSFDAAIRGANEELRLTIPRTELIGLYDERPTVNTHESSVYPGIVSRVLTRRFVWETSMEPAKSINIILKDGSVSVHIEWFQGVPADVLEWMAGLQLSQQTVKKLQLK